MENFDYKKYRKELTQKIKEEPDKSKRREILEQAQTSDKASGEYKQARMKIYLDKLHRRYDKLNKNRPEITEQMRQKQEQENKVIDEILKVIFEKYGLTDKEDKSGILYILRVELKNTAKKFGGIENLKGKRILDIGCGSTGGTFDIEMHRGDFGTKSFGDDSLRIFEPWLCRGLLELGADPVGIDIGELNNEKFEHHRRDLTEPRALDFLGDESFDGVRMRLFLSSPELENTLSRKGIRDKKKFMLDLQKELYRQIRRLLKDGGKVLHEDSIFM